MRKLPTSDEPAFPISEWCLRLQGQVRDISDELFSGWEGDTVPAQLGLPILRGQGPLLDLTVRPDLTLVDCASTNPGSAVFI